MDARDELVLRQKIQDFVRAFGLLRSQTPCGKPVSVSAAHAVMLLRSEKHGHALSQSALQKTLFLDKSNITRLSASLENDGFISQRQSKEDRRVRELILTKKGERLADSLLVASQERFSEILNQIPKSRRAQVFSALELLTNAIQKSNFRTDRDRRMQREQS
jgi:DNA-binding MarR family transcriptional regulator